MNEGVHSELRITELRITDQRCGEMKNYRTALFLDEELKMKNESSPLWVD